ncbi:hypothetical protein [Hoeflea halophila]|uniref:hypothetical protein n=1 Tax=Hoeflea halophila TaxID=714899 RepID=UPI001AEFE62F|nr:hypothetical protein [Hoeflea halophila]
MKLAAMIYIVVGSMFAGSFVVATLTLGRMEAVSISVAAVLGALTALPVAWLIAAKLNRSIRPA